MRLLHLIWLLGYLGSTIFAQEHSAAKLNRREEDQKEQEQEQEKEKEQVPPPAGEIELPPSLSTQEFDKLTSRKLVLVEFYSPYCHHCKDFFPKWKEAYLEIKTKFPQHSEVIDMRQVNCVENGDLCEREMIDAYPMMLLYAPVVDSTGQPVAGKSKNIDAFPRNLAKTADNVVKYVQESVAEYGEGTMASSSKMLSLDDMFKAISGEIDRPMFVSFWQATRDQWDSVDLGGKMVKFSGACVECLRHKQTWDRLSNKIIAVADSGHVMCQDNPELCKRLQLDSFLNGQATQPQYIMFLPKDRKTVRFDYDGVAEVSKMKWWVYKLFENSAYEVVSARSVTEVMEYSKSLRHEPIAQYYPLKSKITVLFYYDVNTVVPEDEVILPYMLRTLQASPFNVQLYKAKHKKIEENVQTMGNSLIEFINYDGNDDKYELDKALQIATTITEIPTIYVFKDNCLIPEIYQNFAVEDMRQYDKIEKWLQRVQFPFYGELKPELVSTYFPSVDSSLIIPKKSKVVIVFVDLENQKQTDEQLYKLSLVAHEYNYIKRRHQFQQIVEARNAKHEKVEKLKAANADKDEILQMMRQKVPHPWDEDDAIFTFLDKSKSHQFRGLKNWKINPKNYEVGDVVVVSRDHRYFWNTNADDGARLRNEPKQVKRVLVSLLNEDGNIERGLVGSPYSGALSFMNLVHEYGIFGYIAVLVAGYFVAGFIVRVVKRRRYRSQGIIGVNNGNNNQSFLPKKD